MIEKKHNYWSLLLLHLFALILSSCDPKEISASKEPLFELIPPDESGVQFSNTVQENFQNFFGLFNYVYNGGGVAIGDINNDGLSDLFFTGNEVPNRLYLNQGNLQFKDITKSAGLLEPDGWDNGVVMADVNGDGLLDIYLSRGGWEDPEAARRNLLYINQGDLTFQEQANNFGLADTGYSIQAVFFDLDNDQDLDMYLCNRPDQFFLNYRQVLAGKQNPQDLFRDKLYLNEQGHFREIGLEAGITDNFGYGLGLITADFNQDNYVDIYVANDFLENDYLYINQKDGTFKEQIKQYTNHIPFYSMGVDMVDINNDGMEDIIQLDMLPADYKRSKTTMASMNIKLFDDLVNNGFHHQYMHNMLQLNQGNGFFSEIGQFAGISKTDWSWSCLGSDFDNDGYKDIFISNGFKRDIWNKDAQKKYQEFLQSPQRRAQSDEENAQYIIQLFETNKIANYLFHNQKDLSFSNQAEEWGLDIKSFSNGAAVGDLDNDGDLDLVVNNLEEPAFIFRNNAEKTNTHYLKIKLEGPPQNTFGLGAKIRLEIKDQIQYHEFKTVRGYLSSVEPIIHFGLAQETLIDKLTITWSDGKENILTRVKADQLLNIRYQEASTPIPPQTITPVQAELEEIKTFGLDPIVHLENDFNDYKSQLLLPHKLSQLGPCLAVGDINQDGLEDFFIGGAHQQAGRIFIQNQKQQFSLLPSTAFDDQRDLEDTDAIFFDADGDLDLDLYVVSGGNEFQPNSSYFQDRLYLNDGTGNFELSDRLPVIKSSGACVRPCDFDQDGDIDLFVGGRLVPFQYPRAPRSYLLENQDGYFKDVSDEQFEGLANIGMVTDAVWTDIDGDQLSELILVGEWMPISIFKKSGKIWKNVSTSYQLDQTAGWWNCVKAEDLDQDGDMDFVVGNIGLNYKFQASAEKPFQVFAGDFDKNGTNDIFLAKYDQERLVPIRGKECSSQQMPSLNKKFTSYEKFADADLNKILDGKIKNAPKFEAKQFASLIIENRNGQLLPKKLPKEAQFSSVNGIICSDFNQDGKQDILIAGNKFESEIETTRADASPGLLLLQEDKLNFRSLSIKESGFFMPYNVKALQAIGLGTQKESGILVGINNGRLRLFKDNKIAQPQQIQ